MNFEFEREIGFINSQPSLAECLTSFPAVLESFQTSSIKESTVIPPPFEHTIPSLSPCAASQPRPAARSQQHRRTSVANGFQTHHRGAQQLCPGGQPPAPAGPLAHEFPWMKEKKSSKKSPKPGGGGFSGGCCVISTASSSLSPTASGYMSAGIESPTGRYAGNSMAPRVCVCGVCVVYVCVCSTVLSFSVHVHHFTPSFIQHGFEKHCRFLLQCVCQSVCVCVCVCVCSAVSTRWPYLDHCIMLQCFCLSHHACKRMCTSYFCWIQLHAERVRASHTHEPPASLCTTMIYIYIYIYIYK